MTDTVHPITYIVSDPEILGGMKSIAGTRIAVNHVVSFVETGQTPSEIAENYDLTLAQVYAALAYYHAHPEEIAQELRDQGERIRKFKE